MANCFCSGWPQEAGNCADYQSAELSKDTTFQVPWLPTSDSATASLQFYGCPSTFQSWSMPMEAVVEDKAGGATKSHSQAEKRRRDRINAQLATLRKLIPKSDKMDKAALLGSVVEHVRDLKRKALEVSKLVTIPSDVDEVTVDYDVNQASASSSNKENCRKNIFIKASVCCDDRPELFAELSHALEGLKLTTVSADITSLGGRSKSIFVLCTKDGFDNSEDDDGVVCMNTLKQSLKVVLSRIATSYSASSYRIKSKRQRFFLPSYGSQ